MKIRSSLAVLFKAQIRRRCFWRRRAVEQISRQDIEYSGFPRGPPSRFRNSKHMRELLDCSAISQITSLFVKTFCWLLVALKASHLEQTVDSLETPCITHKPVLDLKDVCQMSEKVFRGSRRGRNDLHCPAKYLSNGSHVRELPDTTSFEKFETCF